VREIKHDNSGLYQELKGVGLDSYRQSRQAATEEIPRVSFILLSNETSPRLYNDG